ncbi:MULTISPECIES: FitA-like ribbon-helix-helix domain-containing protein [unclassified Bradyrhizobium]|uniref:FitA-like ribbon-helix-helix domain-containing protein n=1 Tax=unclassified Bradyrhizobium TaxID=2631580 RepID=UPI0028EFBAF0|nr:MULTISPECIES: plasmid stability protein y4jJ [unclassified Bradyrhizobium]
MADILIRDVDETTMSLLRRRAELRGLSLDAYLFEILEKLAREEAGSADDDEPFGSWLFSISRPGVDLDEELRRLREPRSTLRSFQAPQREDGT